MKIYISFDKDTLKIKGFYDELSSNIPSPYILINENLYTYLQGLTEDFKIKDSIDFKEVYTIEDTDIFEIIPFEYEKPKPNKIDLFEEQNAFLIKEGLEKDIQIKDLNMNLAQTTLNLVNKDIQIKSLEKDIANLILKSLGGK